MLLNIIQKKIQIKLLGGLGNQMFQYALGRALTYPSNRALILDISWFSSFSDRIYQLGQFNIAANIAFQEEVGEIGGWKNILLSLLKRNQNGVFQKIYEKSTSFDSYILSLPDNSYLIGYWQSEMYFINIENIIRQDFQFTHPPIGENKRIIPELKGNHSVAIHIRRGDYIANPSTNSTHGVCSLDYYNRAMEYIESYCNEPHYYIFSDDPKWARQNITSKHNIKIIDWNQDAPYEDLRLMSLCNHHIIANSSFSWWGAWLGKKEGQIVIAPDPWFNDPIYNTSDIYVRDWVCIPK